MTFPENLSLTANYLGSDFVHHISWGSQDTTSCVERHYLGCKSRHTTSKFVL